MNEDALSAAEAGDLLLEAIDLARAGSALDLRMARVLAALKRMDLTRLGYSSFGNIYATLPLGGRPARCEPRAPAPPASLDWSAALVSLAALASSTVVRVRPVPRLSSRP